jgi:hypothetical protein
MHERYAYGAVIFLMLLIPDRRFRWLAMALGVVFTMNLLAAIPPTPAIGELIAIDGLIGLVGSMAMLIITAVAFSWLLPKPARERSGQDHQVAVVADTGGL